MRASVFCGLLALTQIGWAGEMIPPTAYVARRPIRAGELLSREMLIPVDSREPDALQADEVSGLEAALPIGGGALLRSSMIRRRRVIREGDRIRVTIRRGNIAVSTWAMAVEGASSGEAVRVRNPNTSKVYSVVALGPGLAEIRHPIKK